MVKFTGKYSPLKQWLHLDAFEALPSPRPAPDDCAPRQSRYDDLVAMYGAKFVAEKLGNARTFVVGCGALGCEYLKNFALLGVGTGPQGQVVVTDNDRIEVSNLNRQVCCLSICDWCSRRRVGVRCECLTKANHNTHTRPFTPKSQFLFREKNVGQPKSVAASQAAVQMNSTLKVGGWG